MTIIDKREIPLTVTFGDLAFGDAFQDNDGDINIKIGFSCAMYWSDSQWIDRDINEDTLIIPLEVTYTFGSKENAKND